MKIQRFDVLFDQDDDPESPVYFAGEEIRGRILLLLKEEAKINEILLEFKAGARTYWTKHSGKSRRHFRQSEPYFCEQFNTRYTHAYGKSHERLLPAGEHEIPFSYKLSKTLPSSFEGEYGFVRYTCKALLERPWDHDVICKRAFSVVGLEDLNLDPRATEPINISQMDFTLQHCFRRLGTVGLSLCLPKTGYAPGEKLHIDIDVKNDCAKPLTKFHLFLRQRTRYMAKDFHNKEHVKETCRTLATLKFERPPIAQGSSDHWKCSDFILEPVAPKLIRCTIIDINYSVDLEIGKNVSLSAPILVGTIPLVPTSNDQHKAASFEEVQLVDNEDAKFTVLKKPLGRILTKMYPNIPLPIFEKCRLCEVDIQDDKEDVQYGKRKFTPKYPFYKMINDK